MQSPWSRRPHSALRAAGARPLLAALFALAAAAAGARAQPLGPLPAVPLPAVPSQPGMLCAPGALPVLQARRAEPAYAGWYAAFRGLVDANLGRVTAALGDDLLGRFAKAAAMLHALGEQPPANGGGFATYRDAAAAAIAAAGDRTPNLWAGSGTLQPQYDASTLQCMAEAYDLLRGSGLSASQDTAVRSKIFRWASAMTADVPLGLNPSNMMAKAGAALVSTALALPDEAAAPGWLATGLDYLNRALADRLAPEGWWREGPHYANYTLNNLISTAWHVRHRTGVDWFATLRPMVEYALAAQLPDGTLAPYEEGLPVSFPFHTLIAAYAGDPALQGAMAWAWNRGGSRLGSYLNQQQHDVTAFAVFDAAVAARPPAGAPASFLGGETNLVVLRSGFGPEAVQLSLLTAVDYSQLELVPSRHNLRNPLDLVLYAQGQTLLPTSGGGPQITGSARRAHYLDPASRHTVLVNGEAPFIAGASQVVLGELLDEEADAETPAVLLDAARTTVRGAYRDAEAVHRTVALVGGGEYALVADEVEAASPVEVALPWRGRGARQLGAQSPTSAHTRWSFAGAVLEHTAASDGAALDRVPTSGWYASAWNQEEPIEGIELRWRSARAGVLHVLQPRAPAEPSLRITEHGGGGVAVLEVAGARATDWIGLAAGGAGYTAGRLGARAALALVRIEASGVRGAAVLAGTEVRLDGRAVLRTSAPRTAVAVSSTDRIRLTFAADTPHAPVTVWLEGFAGVDPGRRYRVVHRGAALPPAQIGREGDAIRIEGVSGPGVWIVAPEAAGGGGGGAQAGASSGGGSSGGGCALSGGPGGAGGGAGFVVLLALWALARLAARRC